MALSGSTSFTITRDDCIKASLRLLRELGAGETPSTEDFTNCNQALNIVLKSWQKKSIPLWKIEELSFPFVTGISSYPIGPTAGYLDTAGITVTDGGTGGTDGTYALTITDAGGGTGAAGTYTIAGGLVTVITITTPGSGYVSPVLTFPLGGVSGVTYTIDVVGLTTSRPLRFQDAWIRIDAVGATLAQDTPLFQISRQEYDQYSVKQQQGIPNQYWYDPQLGNGILTFYNIPSDLLHSFHGIAQTPIEDMVSSADNFDLPQEWFQAIKWGLADELSLEYGCSRDVRMDIAQKAMLFLEECFNFSVEEASTFFTVDRSGR